MSNDKMREEFENAVKRDWPSAPLLRLNQVGAPGDGFYRDDRIQHAWWGWQSSRAALVVQLPKFQFMDHLDAQGYYKSQVKHAIQDLGLAVKP